MSEPSLRSVTAADAEALLAIYAPYVRHTAVTFEYEVPTAEEFRRRILATTEKYPWFCLEAEGRTAGEIADEMREIALCH